MLLALALVLVQALVAVRAHVVPLDVESLCAGKQVDLTSLSQLKSLAEAARASSCPNYLKGALIELSTIIEHDKENLCSTDAIDTLRQYYTQYLDNASIKEDHKRQLPEALRKLVVAYGLQMSNLCKKQMVRVLSEEARGLLDAADFETVDKVTNEESPIAGILRAMGDSPDEILLPGDLAGVINEQKVGASNYVHLQTQSGPYIEKLKRTCEFRLKPLYEPLMIPLVRLSNMGFNYKDEPLKCALECPKNAREVAQWSRIVFLCESLAPIKVVWQGVMVDHKIRVLSEEEARALPPQATEAADLVKLVYEPRELVKLSNDEIYERANARFEAAVKSFKVGESEAQLAKRAMAAKGMAVLKAQLRAGNVGVVMSAALKALLKRNTSRPETAIVGVLDSMDESQGEAGMALVDPEQVKCNIMMLNVTAVVLVGVLIWMFLMGVGMALAFVG